eukprot:c19765_g1_i2.p1 GENE.c19765_g1_i2~~c19765_g1_i2.p1  ORF type:complete len:1607 (-),score=381.49 c19765_g1_i2:1320-5537(-)
MNGERDHIIRQVLPRLQRRFASAGINVVPVDLRWGITAQALRERGAIRICLDEVDRCRPLFVGMIGDRYGSRVEDYSSCTGSNDPRYEWLSRYKPNRSITELEIAHCAAHPNMIDGVVGHVFVRDPEFVKTQVPVIQQKHFEPESPAAAQSLSQLREQLDSWKSSGSLTVDTYTCGWKEGATVDRLQAFGDSVYEYLARDIEKMFGNTLRLGARNELFTQQSHADVVAKRFVGRQQLVADAVRMLSASDNDLTADPSEQPKKKSKKPAQQEDETSAASEALVATARPVVVTGGPGSGKSAVLASAASALAHRMPVVSFFAAASTRAVTTRTVLESLCRSARAALVSFKTDQHKAATDAANRPLPGDLGKLRMALLQALERLRRKHGRFAVFIDGIGHLHHDIDWIPLRPILGGRFCVSADNSGDGMKLLDALQRRFRTLRLITVGPLAVEERKRLVQSRLRAFGKQLDEKASNDQLSMVVTKKSADLPLFLSVVCDELRTAAVFENLTELIRSMPANLPQLYAKILSRIEADLPKKEKLIRSCLSLLLVSRAGLSESDLLLVLSNTFPEPLPRVEFAPIRLHLDAFLTHRGGLLTLGNHLLKESVEKVVKSQNSQSHKLLVRLYRHVTKADQGFSADKTFEVRRALIELPYHYAVLRDWSGIRETLCDLGYLAAVVKNNAISELLDMYHTILHPSASDGFVSPPKDVTQDLQEIENFLLNSAASVSARPSLLLQLTASQPQTSAPYRAGRKWLSRSSNTDLAWLENIADNASSSLRFSATLSGGAPSCMIMSHSGKYMAVGAADWTVCVVAVSTGEVRCEMRGHSLPVTALAFSPDDRILCSASEDQSIRLWDSLSGEHLHTFFNAHFRAVSGVAFSSNSSDSETLLTSVGLDAKIKLWSCVSRKCITAIHGHTRPITCLTYAANGQVTVCGDWDGCLWVRHALSGQLLVKTREHASSIHAVASHGYRIASCDITGTVKLWDLQKAERGWGIVCASTLVGHSDAVHSVAWTSDGQFVVSASSDNTTRVWDARPARQITAARVHPNGRHEDWVGIAGACFVYKKNKSQAAVLVAAAGADSNVYVIDMTAHVLESMSTTGSTLRATLQGTRDIACTAIDSAAGVIVAGYKNGAVVGFGEGCKINLFNLPESVTAVAVRTTTPSAEDFVVVAGDTRGGLHLTVGSSAKTSAVSHRAHEDQVTCVSFAVAFDRVLVVSGSRDKLVRVFEVTANANAQGKRRAGSDLAAFVNGAKIAVNKVAQIDEHRDWISACAVVPQGDKQILITAAWDMRCLVFDLSATPKGDLKATLAQEMPAASTPVTAIASSESRLVLASLTEGLRVFDLTSPTLPLMFSLTGHAPSPISRVEFLAWDNETLMSCGTDDATVKLWSLKAGGQVSDRFVFAFDSI